MLFHEIKKLEVFKDAFVLVDDKDTSHRIKEIYILHSDQVPKKIEKGGLFFVNSDHFSDDDEKMISLFGELIKRQAAGMIYEQQSDTDMLSGEIIDYAQKNNFPIMAMPYDIAVTQGISQIYYALFDEKIKQNESKSFMRELLYGNQENAILQLANFNYRNEKPHIVIFFSFDKRGYDRKMINELALVMPINLSLTSFSNSKKNRYIPISSKYLAE